MPGDGTAQYHLAMTTEQGKPGINGGIFKKFAPDSKPVYFIGVANMDQSLSKVTGNGGRVLQPKMAIPGIGWFAVIADPEGNSQGVFQDDKAAK
jgi:predicted enzyme related to lactoylglutathione lyase